MKINKIALLSFILLSIISISADNSQIDKNKNRISQIENQIKNNNQKITTNKTKISDAKTKQVSIQKEINTLNANITKLQKEYNALESKYIKLLKDIGQNEVEIKKSISQINDSKAKIDNSKSEYYDRINTIDQIRKAKLLNSLDSNDVFKQKQNQDLSKILEYQAQKIKDIEDYKKDVEDNKKKVEVIKERNLTEADKVKNARKELENKKAELNTAKAKKDKAVNELKKLQATLNSENKTIESNNKKLIAEKRKLEQQIQAIISNSNKEKAGTKEDGTPITNFVKGTGELSWPISGNILVEFAKEKVPGLKSNGIEISGKIGQTVKASDRGTVIHAGNLGNLGGVVIIDHGNIITVYGNLDSVSVKKGNNVEKGQKIGTLGLDSVSKKPALYFETRKGVNVVNPLGLL